MADRNRLNQDTQVRSSRAYDDTQAPGAALATQVHLEGDLNALRSQVCRVLRADGALAWSDDVETTNGKRRAVGELNAALDALEGPMAPGSTSDAFVEVERVDGLVARTTSWTDATKTVKIREVAVSRVDGRITAMVETQHNAVGAAIYTMTHTITRADGFVVSVSSERA